MITIIAILNLYLIYHILNGYLSGDVEEYFFDESTFLSFIKPFISLIIFVFDIILIALLSIEYLP